MMRITKLMVIGVLAGTLGLVGCGDGETIADGGNGGTAGSGGSAGSGGEGGTGGTVEACGAGESIDESFTTAEGLVDCNALGVIDVPIGVVLAAKAEVVDGETEVQVQVQFIIDEDTVGDLGALVQQALIGEASADVDDVDGDGNALVNVPAVTPCSVDFTLDSDDNGTPGPVLVTTPVLTSIWTAVDGSIVLEAVEMDFAISQPVPLPLSTREPDPACTWTVMPTVTLTAP